VENVIYPGISVVLATIHTNLSQASPATRDML
jgi:hypothetical protein